jgi:hypothetical protein
MTIPADGLLKLVALRAAAMPGLVEWVREDASLVVTQQLAEEYGATAIIGTGVGNAWGSLIVAAANWLATDGEAALAAMELGAAWQEAEGALPEGWVPLNVSPDEDWAVGDVPQDEPNWQASTCSLAFFNGETDADAHMAYGKGPSPSAALRALAAALKGDTDAGQ